MSTIEQLAELIMRFPGIGPRQAKRIVYFLLTQDQQFLNSLSEKIEIIKKMSKQCTFCHRYFSPNGNKDLCTLCSSPNRSQESLMIVEKDVDLDNIERSGAYDGRYFVLGGVVSLLDKELNKTIRSSALLKTIKEHKHPLKEVVLALSATPAGEETALHITELLEPLSKKHKFSISKLGRGLSTGSELEYVDSDTIKSALERRV